MRQIIKQKITKACILMLLLVLTACSRGHDFKFENPQDALNACESELKTLSKKKRVDIKELTEITNRWIALQDSSIHILATTTDADAYAPVINSFFQVTDSIRSTIIRLSKSQHRTMEDAIYLKVNVTYGQEAIRKNKDYKEALDFYAGLDKNKLISSPDEAMKAYKNLFSHIDSVKKENDLFMYIAEEDRCYRSLLQYQTKLNAEIVEDIAEKTENFFNGLQQAVSKNNSSQNARLLTYLNIRINRRMVQYAQACASDIDKGMKITGQNRETYRWALLQPYLTIDKFLAAYLTDEQKETLSVIGTKLPDYFLYIDDLPVKIDKKKKGILTERLKDTMLSMTLKQNI